MWLPRLIMARIVSSGLFGLAITLLIVINTIVLSLDHYPSST